MMKTRIFAIGAFLVLLVGLWVTVVRSGKKETPSPSPAPPPPGPAAPAPANTPPSDETSATDPDADRPVVLGVVRGEEAGITARVPAKVTSILGPVGTRVARGQVAVTLDDHDVRLQAEQARQDATAAAAQV